MKKVLVILAMVMAMPLVVSAQEQAPAPCVQATLADYLEEGFSCTIEDKVFSDFHYDNPVQPTDNPDTPEFEGPNPVDAGSIIVTPDATPLNPGLTFNGGWSSQNGTSSDIKISFTITVLPGGNPIEDASLAMVSGTEGSASAFATEVIWLGCEGPCENSVQLLALDLPGDDSDHLFAHTTFDPVMVVTVEKDILLSGFGDGFVNFATVTIIHQNFSEVPVPEPATLTLLGTGLLAIGGKIRRMRKNAKSS